MNDRWKVVGSKTREEIGREERSVLIREALDEIIPKDLSYIIDHIAGY